jgi:hypothetical protein
MNRGRAFPPPANPLLQILSLLAFVVLLIGAVFVGAVILSLVLGLAAIAALVFSVRIWWLRRKLRKGWNDLERGDPQSGQIIDVSYTVVEERSDRPRRPSHEPKNEP